jgi:hypothetical protein
VILSDTIRPRLRRLSFVLIGLAAISVFTWGLQYKLSLYYPKHSAYHQLPEAKLLSRNEQAAATEHFLTRTSSEKVSSDLLLGGLFTLTPFVWVLEPLRISEATRTEPERTRPWLVSLSAHLNAFFFRPPPTFVSVSNC